AVADRPALRVDGHDAAPLRRDRHGDHARRVDGPAGQRLAHAGADRRPPALGVLHRAAVGRALGLDRRVARPDDAPGGGDEPDLRPAGALVDGEDDALSVLAAGAHAGSGTLSCASRICAMTPRIIASASTVSPPGTPP